MSRWRFLAFSTAVAILILAVLEGGLRVAGYEHEAAPVVLRFGYPNPREIVGVFQPDPVLFWRLRPRSIFDAEGPVEINERGYRGPVASDPRVPGTLRVAVMGDSVAFGAAAAWPELLAERLRRGRDGRPVEVLNFGVPGYSVVQGLRQLPEVTLVSPDVIVVSYGWNDHWLARGGLQDSARRLPSPLLVRAASLASRLRFVQLFSAPLNRRAASTGASNGTGAGNGMGAGGGRRVPPEEYEKLLRALVGEIRSAGAAPIIVSLPSGLVESRFPPYLVDMGFTRTPAEAIADHRLYGELARRAAVLEKAPFVALQPLFDGPEGVPVASLFSPDGIHPAPEGHERIADALADPVLEAARAR